MSSDPSTKDLIEAARKVTQTASPNPMYHYVHALADRLEEVDRDMDGSNGCLSMVWETLVRLLGEDVMERTPPMMYPEAIMTACAKVGKLAAETGNPTPDLPLTDSPEPSDPEPDRSDEHKRHRDAVRKVAERMYDPEPEIGRTAIEDGGTYNPQWMPPDEDRLSTLETEMRHRVTKVERKVDALEGHADRGSEAEAELRGRVGRLEYREEAARRTRVNLMNDRDALAERIEKLDEERKVSLEARRHLLDEVQKLWMRLDGEGER